MLIFQIVDSFRFRAVNSLFRSMIIVKHFVDMEFTLEVALENESSLRKDISAPTTFHPSSLQKHPSLPTPLRTQHLQPQVVLTMSKNIEGIHTTTLLNLPVLEDQMPT